MRVKWKVFNTHHKELHAKNNGDINQLDSLWFPYLIDEYKSERGQNQKQCKTNYFENGLSTGRTVLIFNSKYNWNHTAWVASGCCSGGKKNKETNDYKILKKIISRVSERDEHSDKIRCLSQGCHSLYLLIIQADPQRMGRRKRSRRFGCKAK